ncbi:MAG: DoxX family protein [Acidobacteriales bacterium]|nr:DoxX family protein [Terriglobales bacterium]
MTKEKWAIAVLRIVIGWHFLYEGYIKLMTPGWTATGYLKSATGPLSGFFYNLASNDSLTRIIDALNIWGLVLVGLGLMFGVLVRTAAGGGMALLALYYLAQPPLFSPSAGAMTEGAYLLVNKNLVELCALLVVAFLPASEIGLGPLIARLRNKQPAGTAPQPLLAGVERRELIGGLVGLPVLGAFVLAVLKKHGYKSFEEMNLRMRVNPGDNVMASATAKRFQFSSLRDLKGELPYGRIGKVKLSRMILGGNLMGGWSHARDLIYVSKLVKAYHNRSKIFQTFDLAEACGVNTILTNPVLCGVISDYWRSGGKIQFISDCGGKDILVAIQKSIDQGACACYIQGGTADDLVAKGRFDLIEKGIELIRRNGLPAGIGGHKLSTIQACVDRGYLPDFWMKTLHKVDYWSARLEPECDNIWCQSPEDVAAYMRQRPEPWIAFKTLAAGAIEPKVGFKYAFDSGADFICVGMYDFQIVDDVNLLASMFDQGFKRDRTWRA